MNVFELFASITLDTKDYEAKLEDARSMSKEAENAFKSLQTPLDKIQNIFNTFRHPIEAVKNGFQQLKDSTEAVRHPIETLRQKISDAATELETKRNKLTLLSNSYEAAKQKVADLTKEFNDSAKESGVSSEKTQELARKLNEAEQEADQAKQALDGYSQEVSKSGTASEKAAQLVEKLGNGLGKGLAVAGKATLGVLSAVVVGIASLSGAATQSFSEFEQLAGGAAKIFDQMDQSKILADAQNAYKTLGIDANRYLSIMNDVGATFAATMGDEAGYNTASKGLKAISDYASGTGKNIDELSQKFTLITRSTASYQSIADQFSGILPATSAGFLEQAQAAGFLSDSYTQLTEVPIDEYQAAVASMLEQGVADLGLANNTAAEAMTTISGSLSMAKAAYKNLVTGIADENADLEVLVGNFVESVGAVAQNVIPKVRTALENAGEMIETVIPTIIETIFPLIEEHLPAILKSGVKIIKTLLEGILQNSDQIVDTVMTVMDVLIDGIIDLLPEIVVTGVILLGKLAVGIIQAIPDLIAKIPEIITAVVEEFKANGDTFSGIGKDIVTGIWNGIKAAWNAVVEWVGSAVESVMNFISGSKEQARQEIESIEDIPVSGGGGSADSSGGAGRRTGTVNVTQNIYSEAKTAADLMEEAQYQQKKAVWLGVLR